MRRVTVNKENKAARVDGGCLLGDVDHETQLPGLAVSPQASYPIQAWVA